jgi:hypothetical protein
MPNYFEIMKRLVVFAAQQGENLQAVVDHLKAALVLGTKIVEALPELFQGEEPDAETLANMLADDPEVLAALGLDPDACGVGERLVKLVQFVKDLKEKNPLLYALLLKLVMPV